MRRVGRCELPRVRSHSFKQLAAQNLTPPYPPRGGITNKTMSLELKNLHITTAGLLRRSFSEASLLRRSFSEASKEIVKGLNLKIKPGEVHALMGPNGSGKSTLANAIMGHPKYQITAGQILLDRVDITHESPDKRAKRGLFLSMQYPPEIPGVTITNFLRLACASLSPTVPIPENRGSSTAVGTRGGVAGGRENPITFHKKLLEKMEELQINPEFARRSVNAGFSGGEKKRVEILQLAMLNPRYAILDETDSGLDVDALKIVAEGINHFKTKDRGILLITHYNRILKYVVPDIVHVMVNGKIVKSGGKELAEEIERDGYVSLRGEA